MPEPHGLQYQRQRTDGLHSWRIRPYVGQPPRRVSVTFTTPTKAIKAARKAAHREAEHAERQANEQDSHAGTVDQLLTDWLERATNKSPRTLSGYQARAGVIRSKIGSRRSGDLSLEDVDVMYHGLRRSGTSEASLLEIHRVLLATLRWGRKRGRVPVALPDELESIKPKHKPPKVDPPTPDQLRRVLSSLPDAEWARAVSLLALCGMRRGEVVGLRLADVGGSTLWVRHSVVLDDGDVHVQPYPKSKEQREIDLHPAAQAVIAQQAEFVRAEAARTRRAEPVWLFPGWDSWRWSEPRNPDSLSRAWHRYRKRHGAEGVRLHDLRHAFATMALKQGRSPADVAAQLGHTDTATTLRIYAHATREGGGAVVSAVADALGYGEQPALEQTKAPATSTGAE